MKKSLFFCLAAALIAVGAVWASNNTNLFNVFGTGASRDTLMFYIEDDGDAVFSQDVAITGTLTTTGATTQTGAMTITGALSLGGAFAPYSRTEAQLKALTPASAGLAYYDSTNSAIVVSTGTGVAEFGIVYGGAAPTGW